MTELNIIRGSDTIRQLQLFCVVRQSHPHISDQELLDWAALRHGQEDERVGESKRMGQVGKRRETVNGQGAHWDAKPTGMGGGESLGVPNRSLVSLESACGGF